VWVGGDGPALLLIHGMAGSNATWDAVRDQLAERFTVIAPDLPGHGRSDKPATDYSLGNFAAGLRDLLVALDVERATVVGQSLGGGIAMQFAYQHPERVERLVLVSSGGLGRDVSLILRLLAIPGGELVMPVLFNGWARGAGNRISRTVARVGIRAPALAENWRAYASLTHPDNRAAFVRTLRAVVDPGGQSVSALDRLYLARGMPCLIVWGGRDPIIPVEHADDAQKAMPGSRLEIFPEAGHYPHCEEPSRFASLLIDFVDTTEPAPSDPAVWKDLLTGIA
jgi:pimeloyl-ACP methyl ester carboxylesterase